MPETTADDGVHLHYIVRGNGPLPVIYLHWMGGDVSTWEGLWEALQRRTGSVPEGSRRDTGGAPVSPPHAAGFRHVAIDFRGHGRSQQTPCTFTHERLAQDILNVANELQLERFAIVGHSFGGKVALRLAAMAPSRVIGLVMVGAVGPGLVPLDRATVEPILSRAGDVAFLRETFRPWFSVWPRPEIDRALETFARTPVWALRAVAEIALWTDITLETVGISKSALILAGEHDPVYGPAYQSASVLSTLPHAQMIKVDCGHGMMLERPQEIGALCAPFLGAV